MEATQASLNTQMDKEWYMYAMEYYSAIKNDDLLLFETM